MLCLVVFLSSLADANMRPLLCLPALFCFLLGLHGAQSVIDPGTARAELFRELISRAGVYNTFSPGPSKLPCKQDCKPLKVGILGAGAAGLYSALLLQSLDIDFEILEADGRVGGRIYTHYFDPEAWKKSTPRDAAYYNYYVSLRLQQRLRNFISNKAIWNSGCGCHENSHYALHGPSYWGAKLVRRQLRKLACQEPR